MHKILIFAKEKPGLNEAIAFLEKYSKGIVLLKGDLGDPFPNQAFKVDPHITISYMSPWILPREILQSTKKWSINFHPVPPEYPGIGCTNFALYNGEKNFGVTAHLMEEKVDTGKIIDVHRFPIYEDDTVLSLTLRCYDQIQVQFQRVMEDIMVNDNLPHCEETWKRKAYTRNELNALCQITIDMDKEEVERRIRATSFPGKPGAYVQIYGNIFQYINSKEMNKIIGDISENVQALTTSHKSNI